MAGQCKRCAPLARALKRLCDESMEMARNSYSVNGRLTEEMWERTDLDGYRNWKKGIEALYKSTR